MGHIVRIQSQEQLVAAIRILNKIPGTWHAGGKGEWPVLLLLDSHYEALLKAGVISRNGKEDGPRGKKAPAKKKS